MHSIAVECCVDGHWILWYSKTKKNPLSEKSQPQILSNLFSLKKTLNIGGNLTLAMKIRRKKKCLNAKETFTN